MAFSREDVAALLVRCHRRCCICHRFCGVKMETDHIQPAGDGGTDDITNAIPVCFECHAEIHAYNNRHPRGRKFTASELRGHKEQWLQLCDQRPESLVCAHTDATVGPIQALIDEIDFNIAAAHAGASGALGHRLREEQFARAVASGSISVLAPDLKDVIITAYVAAGRASAMGDAATIKFAGGVSHSYSGTTRGDQTAAYEACEPLLVAARRQLLAFLGNVNDGPEHHQ